MSANSEYLPPVQSSQDFESLCLDLWREIWGDPNAQKNGRSGQPQAGIDVFGRHGGRRVGIQCKQKDALTEKRLSAAVLEEEVENTKGFVPPLDDFILATTAPRDAKIQQRARELSATAGFGVVVWSWDDIQEELFHRIELLRRIFPIYWQLLDQLQKLPPQRLNPSRLPQAAAQLFGREAELSWLHEAWKSRQVRVASLVAWGGAGKTSLVARFAAELSEAGFDGADYFDWSFYSQGTREHSGASADAFIDAALRFFGDAETAASSQGAWERGARLAEIVGRRRSLLVLDGLEPLQHPATSPVKGALKDPAIHALLRGLAAKNSGFCIVTTRVSPTDLKSWSLSAPQYSLKRLSTVAGVALLRSLGTHGSATDLKDAVEEVKGHALTLSLLGSFLRDAHDGDVRRRDRVELGEADEESGDGHAFGVMKAYERFFEAEGEKGERQLAILRLLGLFDRPASGDCLSALRQKPEILGLTEPLVDMKETAWKSSLKRLAEAGLIEENEGEVDTHPLIREYFAGRLQENGVAWREAHGRLFEYLKESTDYRPDRLAGLEPLYQAVYHGCQAGRQQEVFDEVYFGRILRGKVFYSTKQLGAFGADLGAVACFYDTPWSRVSSSLSEVHQAWILAVAAFNLRALGRLREAVEPMRAGLPSEFAREDWKNAAISASNLSELELTLGDVKAAVTYAEQSVDFADRSGDPFQRMSKRTTLADARHQAGEEESALALFREAERLQAERQPEYPLLYSLQGFQYCDLLLARAEGAAGSERGARAPSREEECNEAERRGSRALEIVLQGSRNLLDIALNHLTLGRARLYRAILADRASQATAEVQAEIEKAVAGLRGAGSAHHIPRGLLTRSWLRSVTGNEEGARADLDEAQEIAERGGMRLHLADLALYRARFFGDRAALAEARRLVEECGYGRRLPEIADLEEKLGRQPPGDGSGRPA